MSDFWLFKAPPHKRARIHKGSCPNCNYGKGQAGQIKKPDGPTSWTGFASLSEAQKAMDVLKYKDTGLCGTCLRSAPKVKTHRIYLTSLELNNVRCFGERQVLKLTDSSGHLAQWTLILGENGVGKTTLLQCLARMRPTPMTSDDNEEPDKIQPELIDEQDNEVLTRFIRKGTDVTLNLSCSYCYRTQLGTVAKPELKLETCIKLASKDGELYDSDVAGSTQDVNLKSTPFIIGYGAIRPLGALNLEVSALSDSLQSLFNGKLELYDAEMILSRLDHAALKKKPRASELLNLLRKALTDILPDISDSDEIEIFGPKLTNNPNDKGGVQLNTPDGDVAYSQLSLGSQTVFAMTVDIAWRMLNQYPDSHNPLAEPAIILVDEIDLHLHPRWQREIRTHLTKHFPQAQFIVTAHSPLVAQAALGANLVVLKRQNNQVVIENDPLIVQDWRIDQVLTSELFGLKSARRLEIERLSEERDVLIGKPSRNKKDKARLASIDAKLEALPTAERHEDQKSMDIIRQAAAFLENKTN